MDLKRQKAALALEKQRRKQVDGLQHWIPYPKQANFIESVIRSKKQENWFIAANRSGKSDAGAFIGSVLARFGSQDDNEGWRSMSGAEYAARTRPTSGWVVALDFATSRDIIQPKYFDNGHVPPGATHRPFIPDHEIDDWSITNQVLRLKNGSIIGFKSADSKRSKFQGTEKDWIHFDEEPPYEIYEECSIRVGAHPLRIFGTCTMLPPEGEVGGVTWLYPHKIQPVLENEETVVGLFGAQIYDNPHIPREEIGRLESIYPEGTHERRIRLEGEWLPGIGGARAYVAFDRGVNVAPQSSYYNPYHPLCWCWDFNVEPMVSLVGQRDGQHFRVLSELVMEEGDIIAMTEMFKNQYQNHAGEIWVYGDATGKSRSSQTGKSSYFFIMNSLGSFRDRLRVKVADKNPAVADRINAMNRACRNELGDRWIQVDPACKGLIVDFETVLRDNTGGIKKTTRKRDPYFRRTHYTDALGYWVAREEPVRSQPGTQHGRFFRRGKSRRIPSPSYGADGALPSVRQNLVRRR